MCYSKLSFYRLIRHHTRKAFALPGKQIGCKDSAFLPNSKASPAFREERVMGAIIHGIRSIQKKVFQPDVLEQPYFCSRLVMDASREVAVVAV